jgi:hypothetical protein
MQDQIAARDLTIEWSTWIEAVIPIDREAKKSLMEFVALAMSKMRRIGTIELKLISMLPPIQFPV